MKMKITRLRNDIEIPKYHTDGSAGFDLASSEDITIGPKEQKLLPTGLIFNIPNDHVLILAARSSLFKKKGLVLANGIGTIDSDYSGPEDQVYLSVINLRDEEATVQAGERIAQGMIIPVVRAEFEEGEAEGQSRGGFGSTG